MSPSAIQTSVNPRELSAQSPQREVRGLRCGTKFILTFSVSPTIASIVTKNREILKLFETEAPADADRALRSMFPDLLSGCVALVIDGTGARSLAIAKALAAFGAKVAITSNDLSAAAAAAAEVVRTGGHAYPYSMDAADRESCAKVADIVQSALGLVSVVVNKIGISASRAAQGNVLVGRVKMEITYVADAVAPFLPQLGTTEGRIINLISVPSSASYKVAKAITAEFTRDAACEFAPLRIRVNAIISRSIDDWRLLDVEANFFERIGDVDEIVGPVLFLASELSAHVTGALLPMEGAYVGG
jgi:NAD(P)-dependent dehydrogenase (short-subunit alcohol dehydrogenase family)